MPRTLVLAVFALAACNGEKGLIVHNVAPSVSLVFPVDGSEIEEGAPVTFQGILSDDSPVTSLNAIWTDSMVGQLEDHSPVDADGNVQFITSNLEPGLHTIVLRAFDEEAESGSAQIDVTVVDVPDKPSIEILHPDLLGEEKGLEDAPFIFQAEVSDHQDPAEDLVVELLANPYGLVCTMSPDGGGKAECPSILPIGSYTLTFTVEDTEGNTASATAPYSVVSRNDYDMDGDGYTPNGGDCNDSNDTIYPGATEICDGLDNDCIEATAIDVGTECYDDDGDGYCEEPPCVNTTATLGDCDDTDASRYPNPDIIETVNGVDDNCDGRIDEYTTVWDDDGDGSCETPPCVNAAGLESDCNDADYDISPDADEDCADSIDNNCDGETNEEDALGCTEFYYDNDGDTYGISGATECWCEGSYPYTGLDATDCYDDNAKANPAQNSFFDVDRGDGDYDYDCDGSEEKQYVGTTSGCEWDFAPFECDINGEGWEGSTPSCGDEGDYVGSCDGNYDALCIFFCVYSDPSLCTSCWSCDPDVDSMAQPCR